MRKPVPKEPAAPEAQVDSLLEAARRAEHQDLQHTLQLAHQAECLAERIGYARGQAEALRLQLHQHLNLGRLTQASVLSARLLRIAESSDCSQTLASAFHAHGRFCHYSGALSEALVWYQKALELRETFPNLADASGTLNNLGLLFDFIGERDQALRSFARALEIRKDLGWRWGEAQVLNNLGNLYLDQDQWEQAKSYYDAALQITREEGDRVLEVTARLNLTEVARQLSSLPEALRCSRDTLRVIRRLKDERSILVAWAHRGMILGELGKHRQARSYLDRAYQRARRMGDTEVLFLVMKELAHYHTHHGETAVALQVWQEGLARAEKQGLKSQALHAHKYLAQLFEEKGEFERALHHFKRFHELDRRRLAESSERFRTTLQASFELERAKRETLLERQRNEQLAALVEQDGMTQLLNHQAFHVRFRQALATLVPQALLLLDVDRFKTYNDTFGHPAGDTLLKRLAQTLVQNVRPRDLVARYGGEEFALLLHEMTVAEAAQFADRLQNIIRAEAFPLRSITVSMGLAVCPPLPSHAELLLEAADAALYAAKRGGRDQWRLAHGLAVGKDIEPQPAPEERVQAGGEDALHEGLTEHHDSQQKQGDADKLRPLRKPTAQH